MRKFSVRRRLLIAFGAISLLAVALALLPKLGFDLPGLIKSPRGWLRSQVSNAGATAGKGMAYWDSFRENYRIKARIPETDSLKEKAQKLTEKYGVKVDYSAYAKASSWGWAYTEGYNSVATRALDDKFQRNVAKEFLKTEFETAITKAGNR